MNIETAVKIWWFDFCRSFPLVVAPDVIDGTWEIIRTCYSEPQRKYHNLAHIYHCIDKLEGFYKFDCARDLSVNAALILHDLIYVPTEAENEIKSVAWGRVLLRALGMNDRSFLDDVEGNILATTHKESPKTWKEDIVVDVDLSILGASWEDFKNYRTQIREEFRHANDDDFAAGSLLLWKKFLKRPRIYNTKYFHNRYEKQARKNLKKYLQELQLQLLRSNKPLL